MNFMDMIKNLLTQCNTNKCKSFLCNLFILQGRAAPVNNINIKKNSEIKRYEHRKYIYV